MSDSTTELAEEVRLALQYSRNYAAATPYLTNTGREHITGLCNLVEKLHRHLSADAKAVPVAASPIDDLVDRFSAALRAKLHAAEAKYGYDNAWTRDDWRTDLIQHMHDHIAKGDPRDVAAYCAFAWHHGWSLAPPRTAMDLRVAHGPENVTQPAAQDAVSVSDEEVKSALETFDKSRNYGGNVVGVAMRAALESFARGKAAKPSVPVDAEQVAASLSDDAALVRDKLGDDSEVADNMERASDLIYQLIAEHDSKEGA